MTTPPIEANRCIPGVRDLMERLSALEAKLQQARLKLKLTEQYTVAGLTQERDDLAARNAKLTTALEWYANVSDYYGTTGVGVNIALDRGKRARAALAEEGGE